MEDSTPQVTLRQLQTLVVLADAGSIARAVEVLDAGSSQQVTKSVDRLGKALGVTEGLYVEGRDGSVTITSEWVLKKARTIVNEHRDLLARAKNTREFWIRIDGFFSHLATFIPPAIAAFETDHPNVRVDVVLNFGSARSTAGSGMLQSLSHGNAELLIFPVLPGQRQSRPPGLPEPQHLYDAVLVAAVEADHRSITAIREAYRNRDDPGELDAFEERVDRRVLSAADLATTRIVCSPVRHITNTLLMDLETSNRRFDVDVTSPDPLALVALGKHTERVPIIASDSAVNWPAVRRTNQPKWFAIVNDDNEPVRWSYFVCWQTDAERVPQPLLGPIAKFKDNLVDEAAMLAERVATW